jgi:hypothetical protein
VTDRDYIVEEREFANVFAQPEPGEIDEPALTPI